jgi:hypothetical protein
MIWFGAAFRSALDAPLRIAGPAQVALPGTLKGTRRSTDAWVGSGKGSLHRQPSPPRPPASMPVPASRARRRQMCPVMQSTKFETRHQSADRPNAWPFRATTPTRHRRPGDRIRVLAAIAHSRFWHKAADCNVMVRPPLSRRSGREWAFGFASLGRE